MTTALLRDTQRRDAQEEEKIDTGEGNVKMEAMIGITQWQSKEHQVPPEAGKGKEAFTPEPVEEYPANTLILGF